ncbi:IclR family transcriptional regulator [Amycolatopsis benzoatilytica]|uniref:IclR family transcriptional regulator n=1 Tax=Amycolatopsis benzoatilytica TaxID=346045 RepID=UPI00037720E7|nr:IclR family transcriptional regulator C-terminal domain-containing protein [Amycolatopsis benzoatilytica]
MAGQRALRRADQILDVVARAPVPLTLSEIAAAVDAPVSSTQDLVQELRACGYLVAEDRRYRLGLRPQVLGLLAGAFTAPAGLHHGELERLSQTARAPLALAVLVGRQVLYLDHAGPRAPQRIQRVTDEHAPRPALRTAAGRLLLAFAADRDREELLRAEPNVELVQAFHAELPTIRAQRIARSDGLADPDIRAIAVPVFDRATVAAAIIVAARRYRAGQHSPALDAAAKRLVAALGERSS